MGRQLDDDEIRSYLNTVMTEYIEESDDWEDGLINGLGGTEEDLERAEEIIEENGGEGIEV